MIDNLRCAVIGVGNMGQHHARIYSQLAKLVAVCDVDTHRGQKLAEQYGVRFFATVAELLTTEQLDAVSVAVPSSYHRLVAEQCLQAKVATLVEKPIATTVTDAEYLIKLAKQKQTALMIGHIERFNPVVQALKKQLDKGTLGEVVSMIAVRSGISPPREPHSHVGLDLTIHDLDVCLYLLEQKPIATTVYTQQVTKNQTADSVSALVKFPHAIATFSTNWLSPIKVRRLAITGTKGYGELDYVKQTLTIYNKPPEVKNSTYRELQQLATSVPKRVHIPRREPLKNELTFFLKHYRQPDTLVPLTTDALTALKIVLE